MIAMKKLYVLPFDHRSSFAKMFGFEYSNLSEPEVAALKDYKHVIYEGFLAALKMGVRKEEGAILVDEEFGGKILEEAKTAGITRILTVEKSGQEEFDFEYGNKFREHINKFRPEYIKALVRYNPSLNGGENKRQAKRLKTLNDFCAEAGYRFLVELLTPPSPDQLSEAGGLEGYEKNLHWKVMRESIRELRAAGIEPDVWKLEGLEESEQFGRVAEETQKSAEKEVGVIVLGRGESGEKVRKWIEIAAKVPGVIGLAVGRTVFKQPLLDFAAKKISREEAVLMIAKNYKKFLDIFKLSGG